MDAAGDDGLTPLTLAALYGDEAGVKLLLNRGANIESENSSDLTTLMRAISCWAVMKLLFDNANMEPTYWSRSTPLSWAASCGHAVVVKKAPTLSLRMVPAGHHYRWLPVTAMRQW